MSVWERVLGKQTVAELNCMGWTMALNRKLVKILMASLFAIGICTTVFWHEHHSNIVDNGVDYVSLKVNDIASSSSSKPNHAPLDHFVNYCHDSLLDNTIFGNEGQLPNTADRNDFKLVQVHGLFRHGDRSPLQQPNLGPETWYECGMIDNDEKWLHLYDFPLKPNPKSSSGNIRHLNTRRFHGFDSQKCSNFQLSFKGFQQLYALGSYMQTTYLSSTTFNDQLISATDILIQSTDYTRTINSASSFSLGLIPADKISRTDIPIHVSQGDLLARAPPNRKTVYSKCRRFNQLHSQELHRSEYMKREVELLPFFEKIGHLLNVDGDNDNDELLGEDVFDIVWGLVCHRLPRPCRDGVCLNDSIISKGTKFVNWLFPQRHLLPSSLLAIQPFLAHSVINEIDIAINAAAQDQTTNPQQYINTADNKPFKLIFNFGHDSTITSLLGSLGIHVDHWVPFASRIVIELWQRKSIPNRNSTNSYYIRILFNGRSLMDRLSKIYQPIDTELDGELVLYDTWKERMTTGPYRNINDYHRKCNLPKYN